MEKEKKTKKRYWAFILYLDSAPENWKELLQETGLKIAISPYHDKDINPGENEKKKPHYHIILAYEGPTTYENVCKITERVNATIPKPLESIVGMYRYLTHKDNPEKYQYDERDIRVINGFNIEDFDEISRGRIEEIKKELIALIRETNIREYSDLIDTLIEMDSREHLEIATNHTFFLKTYIDSRRNKERGK